MSSSSYKIVMPVEGTPCGAIGEKTYCTDYQCQRVWSEISMDYVTEQPETVQRHRHILVITDRLRKGAIFVAVPDLPGQTLAREFIKHFVAHDELPSAIVSD
jgi:hypothetical protein